MEPATMGIHSNTLLAAATTISSDSISPL